MKSIATALAVGVLVVASQAAVADAFPAGSIQFLFDPPQSTYADRHAADPVTSTGPAFPEGTIEHTHDLPAQSTYAASHAADPVTSVGSAFPEGTIEHTHDLPARSTYAASHLNQPVRPDQSAQAPGNSVNN